MALINYLLILLKKWIWLENYKDLDDLYKFKSLLLLKLNL